MNYFIECAGYVKIGFSRFVEGRLRDIQTANPIPVTLLAHIEGTMSDERDLHSKFSNYRGSGEWFWKSPELSAFIQQIKSSSLKSKAA